MTESIDSHFHLAIFALQMHNNLDHSHLSSFNFAVWSYLSNRRNGAFIANSSTPSIKVVSKVPRNGVGNTQKLSHFHAHEVLAL